MDVERFWFRAAVAGEEVELCSGAEAWQVPADMPSADVLGLYRAEIVAADAIITAMPTDAMPTDAMPNWWPDFFTDFPPRPLRRTILHVIAETAAHAGHLDAARELIAGTQWVVLTD